MKEDYISKTAVLHQQGLKDHEQKIHSLLRCSALEKELLERECTSAVLQVIILLLFIIYFIILLSPKTNSLFSFDIFFLLLFREKSLLSLFNWENV